MRVEDYDQCICGDYRGQHSEGWRECNVCTENDGMNGRKCLMYRPWRTAHLSYTKAVTA